MQVVSKLACPKDGTLKWEIRDLYLTWPVEFLHSFEFSKFITSIEKTFRAHNLEKCAICCRASESHPILGMVLYTTSIVTFRRWDEPRKNVAFYWTHTFPANGMQYHKISQISQMKKLESSDTISRTRPKYLTP